MTEGKRPCRKKKIGIGEEKQTFRISKMGKKTNKKSEIGKKVNLQVLAATGGWI